MRGAILLKSDVILVVLLPVYKGFTALKDVLPNLCEPIAAELFAPRKVSSRACLIARVRDVSCEHVDEPSLIEDGLVVFLSPIFMTIDSYLLPTLLTQRGMGSLGAFHKTPGEQPRGT